MSAKKALIVLGCIALFGTTPHKSIAHENQAEASRDSARNHLIDEVTPAVYTLKANFRFYIRGKPTDTTREMNSSGTAFGVTEDGWVMTAFHVPQGPELSVKTIIGELTFSPTFTSPDTWSYANGEDATGTYTLIAKDGTRHVAKIIAVDVVNDLAILAIQSQTSGRKFPVIEFEKKALRYDSVIAIGTPFGYSFTNTEGIISNPLRDMDGQIFVQTDAMVHPGSSGGPLILLRNHRVAGVMVQVYSPGNFGVGLGFAVPASIASKFLEDTLRTLEEGRKPAPEKR